LSGFAKRLGVNKRLLQNLVEGGFLHDIGKSKIDKSILLKPDRLTGSEWNKMKQHTLFGFDIINNLEYHNNTIKNVVLYHHEKYNGKGYPKGLSKDKIPFEAQLTSLCDVFDALTTKRCYKSAVGSFSAFKIMLEEMENHFNPNLLKDFIKYFHI
jgi:HD-GYP domain-containing protein (c-di-GMP phosphodiesterase class II)